LLVSAAYIDLARHARAFEGLASWSTHVVGGAKFGNLGRELKNEQRIVTLVLDAAKSNPAAFTGSLDVTRGISLLERASGSLTEARRLVHEDIAPQVRRAGEIARKGSTRFDPSAASPWLHSAHDDVIEAHRLLGGTRALTAFETVEDLASMPVLDVAPAHDPLVVGRGHKLVQRVVHGLLDVGVGAKLGIRTHGEENVARRGAVLLVPNHGTELDPVFHVRGVKRPVRFIGNAKLWTNPKTGEPTLLGRIIQRAGAFPVDQGNAAAALRIERGVLATGQAQIHYAEGMLVQGDLVGSHADGAARIALEMRVPVVPVGTWGDNKPRMFHDAGSGRKMVEVVYGKVLDFGGAAPTPENIALAREAIARAQDRLVSEAKELYTAHRAASQARRPFVLAATGVGVAAAAPGAGYLFAHD